MSETTDHKRYLFAEFVVDTGRSALLRGDEEISLRPQSFDVLLYLLAKNGELATRDELHDAIWKDRAVTDDSLAQCVVEIRRALDDSDKTLLRTVPRRGYIFAGDVSVEQSDGSILVPRQRHSGAKRAAAIAILAIAAVFIWSVWTDDPVPHSIAVLPFIDMSEEQNLKHVGDGLAEDILNTLAHREDLNVIARTSSFAYSTEARDIESIGAALNVAYVLEGSVRHEAGEYRVVAQLIDTSDSTHVWSEAFLTPVQNLPQVHEQISRLVWRELRPASLDAAEVNVYAGISASEQMMLAREYEVRVREQPEVDQQSLERSIDLYRDATEANPKSAIAFAGLARVLLFNGDLREAERAVDAALRLNPDLSDVQEVLARLRWIRAQGGAGEAWKRAVELNPGSADAAGSYGFWLWMQGRFDEASGQLYRARELDPGSLSRYADLGNFLGHEARIEETQSIITEIQGRFDSAESYRVVARLLDLIGRVDESIAWLIRARIKRPDEPAYEWAIAELLIDIGDYEAALTLEPEPSLGSLLKMGRYEDFIDYAELAVLDNPQDITLQYLLAFAHNALGNSEQAVWLLDRARVFDMLQPETRNMWDLEALHTWVAANAALGESGRVQAAVDFLRNYNHTQSANWWSAFYSACREAPLGNQDTALDHLDRVRGSPRLPALYLFRDAGCLRGLRGNSRYEATLNYIESRQKDLRQKLPATLQDFDVSLQ